MGVDVSAPAPRDYGQETRDTLQAQVDLAPAKYAAEAEFGPQYAQLNADMIRAALTGTNGQPGLLSLYEQDVLPLLTRAGVADQQARISGELGAIDKYAGDVTASLRRASGTEGISNELQRQAQAELAAGTSLTPDVARQVAQGVRSSAAERGFGMGRSDAVAEAFAQGERGLQLQQQRRAFAGQTAGLLQATGGDPFMAILGRPSGTTSAAQAFLGQGQAASPGALFNPESSYAQDIYNTNYNAQAAAKIASANNQTALMSAGIQAAGNMGSSM